MNSSQESFPELNERAKHLLKVLVEQYIDNGQPIASTALASHSGLSLSSATIRNVMANLEDLGLIHAPHTSAGRIPTPKGYRVFVDSLVSVQELDAETLAQMQGHIDLPNNPTELIHSASNLLSGITQLAGIVSLPSRKNIGIRRIEFINLSAKQVLVVLVLTDGEIQNKLLEVKREYSSSELQQATNYLNETLQGQTLQQVKQRLLTEMHKVYDDVDQTMRTAMELADQTFDELDTSSQDEVVMAGKSNLIHCDDLSDMGKLRSLFGAFEEKRQMLSLLNTALEADGVQIFIGNESGYQAFDDCSLVTSTYETEDGSIGVLGVVGPTRMAYERVIPVVDITARLLSATFKK
ncbi:MAG: heat-inducible transcriptional repressor HrcA [Thiotrichaceae bacterium]